MGTAKREAQILMKMGRMGLSSYCSQQYFCEVEGIYVGLCYGWEAVPVRLKEKVYTTWVQGSGLHFYNLYSHRESNANPRVVGLRSKYRKKI